MILEKPKRIQFNKVKVDNKPINIPKQMLAQTVREDRYGEPKNAISIEKINIPKLEKDEVLVKVMSAGLNYNDVWASKGYPVNLIKMINSEPFHISGSDASGYVTAIGSEVDNLKAGDEIVVSPIWYEPNDPYVLEGGDPILAPSMKAWGFETNFGSLAQYCIVKYHQCLVKPKKLSWEEASTFLLSAGTVYRMLTRYAPNAVKKNDVVLIWGGSGDLGVMAIQLALYYGATPVCIVSTEKRKKFCEDLGAKVILRTDFNHWGALSKEQASPIAQHVWRKDAKIMLRRILKLTNNRHPNIVLEHPGADTLPTSIYLCEKGGMVVTCAGTTGYLGTFDLRYLWLSQKRLQGSHGASPDEFQKVVELFDNGVLKPIVGKIYDFENVPKALQDIHDNIHEPGCIAIRIGSVEE